MQSLTLTIDGMHCDGCAERIQNLLQSQAGVRQAAVSYGQRQAHVSFNPHAISEDRIRQTIGRAGFSVADG